MIATIPYTDNVDEILLYLSKYGHDLKYVPTYNEKGILYFKCSICENIIKLICINRNGFIFDVGSELRVIVNETLTENANFYCEKYRLLY